MGVGSMEAVEAAVAAMVGLLALLHSNGCRRNPKSRSRIPTSWCRSLRGSMRLHPRRSRGSRHLATGTAPSIELRHLE